MKPKKPRILIWDVETSLLAVSSFSLCPEFIPIQNIISDWYIICISWKELGKHKLHSLSITKKGDDFRIVSEFRKVLMGADFLIAHNGDKFDMRKFNARLIYYNLAPLPPIRTIDTLKEIRKVANITSNKLDYLGTFLKIGNKVHTDLGLWNDVLKGNQKAIKKMVKYNRQDVRLLESVYLRLRKYFKGKPTMFEGLCCPNCGSLNFTHQGYYHSKASDYRKFKCKECCSWFKEFMGKKREQVFKGL